MTKEYPLIRAESLIPKGMYCYTTLEIVNDAQYGWRMKIDCCPFWEHYNKKIHGELPDEYKPYEKSFQGAYCTYLRTGDWLPNGTDLLWDQVKCCGVNFDFDDDDLAV